MSKEKRVESGEPFTLKAGVLEKEFTRHKDMGGKPGGCWHGSQERREFEKPGEVQDCQMWQEVKLGKSWKAHIELSNMEFLGDFG